MEAIHPDIHPSWKEALLEQFNAPYFSTLKAFLVVEKQKYTVYPPGRLIFNAFNSTPFQDVRVVILGQDPYHGAGQAHGLCFSVPKGIQVPPSLVNIFKELHSEIGMVIPSHGNLESWARQGVLLLNATLTVRAGQAGSHQGKGWEIFTDAVIRILSERKEGLIFLLWGRYAQAKVSLIDSSKHHILTAAHPSPLSAYSGFMRCGHFRAVNDLLKKSGKAEIDWSLT